MGMLLYCWSTGQPPQQNSTAPGSIVVTLSNQSFNQGGPRAIDRAAPLKPAPSAVVPPQTVPFQQLQQAVPGAQKLQQQAVAAPVNQPSPANITAGIAGGQTGSTVTPARPAPTQGTEQVLPERSFGSPDGPTFQHQVLPAYPAMARRRGKEGVVLLRLTISETGQLRRVELLQDPGHGFAEAALEAINRSRFMPARENGRPIATRSTLPVRFQFR